MEKTTINYIFRSADHGIFAEIYFPRKAVHQGTIFTALLNGYNEGIVKNYLNKRVAILLKELVDYTQLFDPRQYRARTIKKGSDISINDAKKRINMYKSPFQGWSVYQVDGVWFNKDTGKEVEESTQVVRVMFRFENSLEKLAKEKKCQDVLRAILFWVINNQDRLDDSNPWDNFERQRFIKRHNLKEGRKLTFVKKYYRDIAKKVTQWIDDCGLFIFGYLVREFAENVIKTARPEAEIWVVSFFNMTVNVVKRTEK